MSELYWLGWIANGCFAARFLDQWLLSERRGESLVPRRFWMLSLLGNGLMALHAALQLQFPIFAAQVANGFISWRNLQSKPLHWIRLLLSLMLLLALATGLYVALSLLRLQELVWVRSPLLWGTQAALSWHLVGTVAIGLFAARFWVQWWYLERSQRATMPQIFWWMSLVGAVTAICYFSRIGDPVNVLGYGVGLIPYCRNLMLMRRRA
jgi:lipid-A-disaccharide synthase-like uncharacterized protein